MRIEKKMEMEKEMGIKDRHGIQLEEVFSITHSCFKVCVVDHQGRNGGGEGDISRAKF